jgi:hypothetical protein
MAAQTAKGFCVSKVASFGHIGFTLNNPVRGELWA